MEGSPRAQQYSPTLTCCLSETQSPGRKKGRSLCPGLPTQPLPWERKPGLRWDGATLLVPFSLEWIGITPGCLWEMQMPGPCTLWLRLRTSELGCRKLCFKAAPPGALKKRMLRLHVGKHSEEERAQK